MWRAISKSSACGRKLVFDRNTASRFGITTSAIDQTLYDAYGQREVSTMFTQLNQYHVVLEVKPGFGKNPSSLSDLVYPDGSGSAGVSQRSCLRNSIFVGVSEWRPDPAQHVLSCGDHHRSHHGEPPGPVSGGDAVFQSGSGRVLGRRRQRP